MSEVLAEIWARATTAQPTPPPLVVALLAILAVVAVSSPRGYRVVRHGVTVLHEVGHAGVALLVGRRLSGIRLHSDTSGVTVSRGRARGPGMVATVLAGYPAPSLVALATTPVLGAGYAVGVLWALVALTALLVVFVRNLYGLGVLGVAGFTVAAASWTMPAVVLSGLAWLLVFTLLLAAPRSVLELAADRARMSRRGYRDSTSDVAQLAALTGVPAALWVGMLGMVTLGSAAVGAWLMVAP
ncbi:MAG TPA: M50 family metallopeptidase [Ornithinimicrobium sp.]|uniref:M50 family metallopeptidase n=1 Tax=Ornithinimicrobium sp. TaxID=1977084 RepID=UPI002B489387|nr:M50 family metallopeptidase [Ornithinimicrobium sp.]HKJ11536.1 M50 family metallopeptidase [Ornithinimicrobium sp.]